MSKAFLEYLSAWFSWIYYTVIALAVFTMALYPVLPLARRLDHATKLEALERYLWRFRKSLSLLLQGAAKLLTEAFDRLYGGRGKTVFVNFCLSLLFILLAVLSNSSWIKATNNFASEKEELDRSVDTRSFYSAEAIAEATSHSPCIVYVRDGICWDAHRPPIESEIRANIAEQPNRWYNKLSLRQRV